MTKIRGVLFCAAIIILVIVCYVGNRVIGAIGFGFAEGENRLDYLYSAGATLFGIAASVMVAGLRRLPEDQRVKLSQLLDMAMRPPSLIALLVSPVVYYAALVAANSQGIGGLGLLAAFQNGFFWEQIMRTTARQYDPGR